MAHKEEAVLSYLMGKSSLEECLTHFPGLAVRLSIAELDAALPFTGHCSIGSPVPNVFLHVSPPDDAPFFEPRGRSILTIVAAASARNGFKDHLIYVNGHTFSPPYGLSELCTETLKCIFVGPGTCQIQAKSLFIDSIISKTPRLESNVVQIEAEDERRFFLTLHRTGDGLYLETES